VHSSHNLRSYEIAWRTLPQTIDPSLTPPLQGGDEGAVRLKVSNVPPSQGGELRGKKLFQNLSS